MISIMRLLAYLFQQWLNILFKWVCFKAKDQLVPPSFFSEEWVTLRLGIPQGTLPNYLVPTQEFNADSINFRIGNSAPEDPYSSSAFRWEFHEI